MITDVMVGIGTENLPSLSATPANSIARFRKPEEHHVATTNLTKEKKIERKRAKQANKKQTNKGL